MQDLVAPAVGTIAAVAIGGYLLGSIPFGLILTRLGGAGDVRAIGSGNIGATNVLRTGRKDLAVATLLLDAGKGAAAVLIAWALFHNHAVAAIAGGAAFLGHLFPVWLGFKGGKGVATFFGVIFAAGWPVGVLAALTWLAVAFIWRLSSLAALAAAVLAPVFAALVGPDEGRWPLVGLAAFMALLIVVRHRENIGRLRRGAEPRIGSKAA